MSRLAGAFLNTRLSRRLIPGFIRREGIDTADFDLSDIGSFNDFFCRPLKPGARPVRAEPDMLISPCDGLLTACTVSKGTVLPVKQSLFTVPRLLEDPALAGGFDGGLCLIYRLCVNNYHRYCWFDSGVKGNSVSIPGRFCTIRPVVLEKRAVYVENSREYAVLESENFGRAVQMEVGAMLVGRIANSEQGAGPVVRGAEKGRFEFGGSTIIVLLRKDAAVINDDILRASAEGAEYPVRMGEAIGRAAKKYG